MPSDTGYRTLSMGYQTIAPGGRVRAHSHGAQVELQICFRGRGNVVVDGRRHPLVPGTACFLGPDVRHAGALIEAELGRRGMDPDRAVEAVLEFLRYWASYHFPRYLTCQGNRI